MNPTPHANPVWTNAFAAQYPVTAVAVDWWEIEYFDQADMDPDFQPENDGFTLLLDYQRGRYPAAISFSISATGRYVSTNLLPLTLSVTGVLPSSMAIMVDGTNSPDGKYLPYGTTLDFSQASWQPYHSNLVAALSSGDGNYTIWVGLKASASASQPTWEGLDVILDTTPPVLTLTNPASGVVAQPILQLQGFANETLSSLTYAVSNATGIATNQIGYLTGQYYDPNLLKLTTNYFQCFDIPLTTHGLNAITVYATDLAGNTATTNVNVILDYSSDTNPPVISVDWPADGTVIAGTNFVLQGTVSDPTATVTISITDANGNTNLISAVVTRSGQILAENIPLGAGPNTMTITAISAAGNTTATNLAVAESVIELPMASAAGHAVAAAAKLAMAPSVIVLSMDPLAGYQLNQTPVDVTGFLGAGADALTVNGVAAQLDASGHWKAGQVPVNAYGKAVFNIKVYANNQLIAQQVFWQSQPVNTVLISRQAHTEENVAGVSYLGCVGEVPPGGPVFANFSDTITWNYLAGGSDAGYTIGSGGINVLEGVNFPAANYQWNNPLPAGEGGPWAQGLNVKSGNEYEYDRIAMKPSGAQGAAGTTAIYVVQAQMWEMMGFESTGIQIFDPNVLIHGQPSTLVTNDDGTLWYQIYIVAPAGQDIDITPDLGGDYSYNVQVWQEQPKILANGIDLSTTKPEFCVGQKIVFTRSPQTNH